MVFTIILIVLCIVISALVLRIMALEEAVEELRAKECLDTTDKHTLTIQECLARAQHSPHCRKYIFTFRNT